MLFHSLMPPIQLLPPNGELDFFCCHGLSKPIAGFLTHPKAASIVWWKLLTLWPIGIRGTSGMNRTTAALELLSAETKFTLESIFSA